MKRPARTITLLAFFIILTLVAIITVFTLQQTPTQETVTNTLCAYSSTAAYDYTAMLKPNTIYYNRTALKPNEGTIYSGITKQINLTLAYTFEATVPAEATIGYSLTQTLTTASWSHELAATAQATTNQTQFEISLSPVFENALRTIKGTIESETGTSSSTYSLQITPTFIVDANMTVGRIRQVFTPTLTIDFQGSVIAIGDLQQTKTGSITQDQTTTRQDVINQRYTSYILVAVSIAGLGISTFFYASKPIAQKPLLEKIMAAHKDLIIETQEPPTLPKEATIINVKNIEELTKTAEILGKPIILTRKPTQTPTLTIIDQNTIYQYIYDSKQDALQQSLFPRARDTGVV